ncbi:MAG: type II secretion system protein [Burkholderiales bacterium]|nr:type II secretion system protein [Burkholderiales bacterium]
MRTQRGFTLIELVVSLFIISLLTFLLSEQFGPFLNYKQRVDTERRLGILEASFNAAYRAEFTSIATTDEAKLVLDAGEIEPAGPNTGGICTSTATTLQAMARYLNMALPDSFVDGGGAPLCFFISPQLTGAVDSTQILYHRVAVVAPGFDRVINSETGCAGSGFNDDWNLRLCGDDRGFLISGEYVVAEQVRAVIKKIERVARVYEVFCQTRFLQNASRNPAINYFYGLKSDGTACSTASRCDAGSTMRMSVDESSCSLTVAESGSTLFDPDLGDASPHRVLGLSEDDVRVDAATFLSYDNCSSRVRSPRHTTTASSVAPFTARIFVDLSTGTGSSMIERTAVGLY